MMHYNICVMAAVEDNYREKNIFEGKGKKDQFSPEGVHMKGTEVNELKRWPHSPLSCLQYE